MREIKFRAWNTKWKQMIYLTNGNKIDNFSLIITADDCILEFDNSEDEKKYFMASVGDIILMQFTGLKDKNGKEIYEGDIVKQENMFTLGKVIWDDYQFDIRPITYLNEDCSFFALNGSKNCEVIGNIWENPELLTEGK